MKISVLNLPKQTTQDELSELFAPYGTVVSCAVVMDKETMTSKGFGFVEMKETAEAHAAIQALNGSRVCKQKIRVKESQAKA